MEIDEAQLKAIKNFRKFKDRQNRNVFRNEIRLLDKYTIQQ
jgi:hypothetical protein